MGLYVRLEQRLAAAAAAANCLGNPAPNRVIVLDITLSTRHAVSVSTYTYSYCLLHSICNAKENEPIAAGSNRHKIMCFCARPGQVRSAHEKEPSRARRESGWFHLP